MIVRSFTKNFYENNITLIKSYNISILVIFNNISIIYNKNF